jgi:DNA polymerase I
MERILVTKKNYTECMDRIRPYAHWVIDTETTGLRVWHGDRICGVSASPYVRGFDVFYFPFRHATGSLPDGKLNDFICELNSPRRHSGWNYKFDLHMLMADGMLMPPLGLAEDVMLAAHLANENERNFKLKDLAAKYLHPNADLEEQRLIDLLASRGFTKGDISKLSATEATPYACSDVVLTRAFRRKYEQELRTWGLWTIWLEVNEYMQATVDMERRGLQLDLDKMTRYLNQAHRKEIQHIKKIQTIAGYDINPASPKQMAAFMNVESTARDVLEAMPNAGPEVKLVINFRRWQRVKSAYYEAYQDRMTPEGVLHPNIKLHGTISGRPSAEDPNLQAVPRDSDPKTKEIYKVKDIFIARPGYKLVSADYSQAELRLGAHLCNEEEMIKIIESGRNLHTEVATDIGTDYDTAKRIDFGSMYGIGAKELSQRLGIPFDIATQHLTKFHTLFPNISRRRRHLRTVAQRDGYIRLWTGRMRRYNTAWAEPHKALSNEVQGGVAEMMRTAIIKIHRERQPGRPIYGTHMLLQVHDQILFEVPEHKLSKHIARVVRIMEDFPQFRPRPKVDIKLSDCWGTVEKWNGHAA